MTQGEIEGIPLPFQQAMNSLEARIMSDIVRRIRINGSVTASAEWQYDRLRQLGESDSYIRSQVQVMLGATNQEINRLFSGMASRSGSNELETIIQAVMDQTLNTFRNLSASLGFAIRGPDGKTYHMGLRDYYQDSLDAAILDIISGSFSYDTVLRRTINQMTNSGLRWIDYESGHHNRVDVAARRAVMTGFNQVQAKINEQTARQLGTDYFEVSYHRGARPDHQAWQGRVYSSAELRSICGLGSVTGLCGANCYHWYDAFVPGISVRTYTDEQLAQMMEEENTPKEYDGKEYTTYEALQRQRRMETLMRKQREDVRLLKEGGASDDEIIAATSRYRSSMAQYVDFSEAMDLPQQLERVYYDGLGRVISGRQGQIVVKSQKGGIINSSWSGLNYTQSYTKQEAIRHLLQAYGIKFTDSRKYPIDDSLLADCVGWLDSFTKEFAGFSQKNPVKLPEIKCATPSSMRGVVGYYMYFPNSPKVVELALNGAYHSDVVGFQKYVELCIKNKHYPANATIHKTFVHEFGHHISNSMKWITNNPTWEHEFIEECIDNFRKVEPNYTYQKFLYDGMTDYVSRYGTKSESELFAEAFAEYFGGENPREFAKIFGRKLEKILKEVK